MSTHVNALPQTRLLPDVGEADDAEDGADLVARRLAELERLASELSGELAWTNERLVAEMYDRAAAEATVDKLARYDVVTALPNRQALEQRVEQALAAHAGTGEPAAVVAVGVASLARVREALGFAAGDRVVRIVADRLRRAVRGSDTVSRIGDDEFALLLAHLRQPEDAARVASKLFDAIDAPLSIDGRELRLEPAVGVAVYPQDGSTADLLLARADAALRFARDSGHGMFQFYRPDLAERSARRLLLEAELRAALERDQFRVLYQPRFDAKSGQLTGAEALLRWQHPERGLLPPAEFIDVAEDSGLIVPIGEHVLRRACVDAAQWNEGGRRLSVSVNLSRREFRGRSLLTVVEQALAEAKLAPSRLQIELAESGLAAVLDPAEQGALEALRALGVRVGLDGFASAGLASLRRWPVDCVKIDGEFIRRAPEDRCDALIVGAIAGVGRRLGLRVVASGVETEAQLALVKKHRCHEVQGYLLGEPVDAGRFGTWLGMLPKPRRARARPRRTADPVGDPLAVDD